MAFWLVIVLLIVTATRLMNAQPGTVAKLPYSEFKTLVKAGNVESVLIVESSISGRFRERYEQVYDRFETYAPPNDEGLIPELETHGVVIRSREPRMSWGATLITWLPILLILFFWLYLMRQMQTGGNRAFSFGKSKAKLLTDNKPKVTFNDVAGVEEAKVELQEVVEFLRDPAKFQRLGGKIPKGALLLGPPGTGKTLLARAIAGEADVPFFSMSGSDFVEMFVGVGASRVRDLFEQGKKNAPCIIFIDEIDAVGRHRGAGLGGGHDEREQTLNQLLVEMDGFESNEGVILVAATNRSDVLDPALLRPGRFDRQIVVDRPDVRGREAILKIHCRKIPLADEVDLRRTARATPGFSGADLANMVNEAALLAARFDDEKVRMRHLEEARDKVMMGAERRSILLSDEERRRTAIHEAGHTLVGCMLPHADLLHKVTIIPRGRALGVTWFVPEDDRHGLSKAQCEDAIAAALGGRVAERIVFGEITTGAGNDLVNVSEHARRMVCDWGMSERVGPLTYGQGQEEIFLGREISKRRDYSEQTAVAIDEEVRKIVDEQEGRATELLTENLDTLKLVAEYLLERETLDAAEVQIIIEGGDLPPLEPDERGRGRGGDTRVNGATAADVEAAAAQTDAEQAEGAAADGGEAPAEAGAGGAEGTPGDEAHADEQAQHPPATASSRPTDGEPKDE